MFIKTLGYTFISHYFYVLSGWHGRYTGTISPCPPLIPGGQIPFPSKERIFIFQFLFDFQFQFRRHLVVPCDENEIKVSEWLWISSCWSDGLMCLIIQIIVNKVIVWFHGLKVNLVAENAWKVHNIVTTTTTCNNKHTECNYYEATLLCLSRNNCQLEAYPWRVCWLPNRKLAQI